MSLEARVAAVREQVPILDVLDYFGVTLRADTTHQIPCPFHPDRSPSARFYADAPAHIYCWTCGRSWDVFGVVQEKEGIAFPEAVTWLEQTFLGGAAIPTDAQLPGLIRASLRRKVPIDLSSLYTMVDAAICSARGTLPLEPFSRACLALDLAWYRWQEHQDSAESFEEAARAILTYVQERSR